MEQITPNNQVSHSKHDIHKFHDIKLKLMKEHWISWKQEIIVTMRDRGLDGIILGMDLLSMINTHPIREISGLHLTIDGNIPFCNLTNEWDDYNNIAHIQILLCISLELQTAIDETINAHTTWKILVKKFESYNSSKISIICMKYESYHMTEGETVSSYITTMKEYQNQLGKMGEIIALSTHAATLLRNLLESW